MKVTRFSVLLLICVFFLTGTASAAIIPDRGGSLIQDGAGMLPAASIPSLEEAAAEGPYNYYVLTIDNLNGVHPRDYSKDVYEHWKLRSDDIFILLSKEDRRIQLYFENSELQRRIDAVPVNYGGSEYEGRPMIDQIVGTAFTPYAKEGDLVRGLIELIHVTNGLPAVEPFAPTSPTIQHNSPTEVRKPEVQPVSGKGSANSVSLLNIVGAAILILVVSYLVFLLITHKRFQTRKQKLQRIAQALAAELTRTMENLETLINVYQGPQAVKKLKPLNTAISEQMSQVQELSDTLNLVNIPLVGTRRSDSLDSMDTQLGQLTERVQNLNSNVTQLIALDKENGTVTTELLRFAQALMVRIEGNLTAHNLHEFHRELVLEIQHIEHIYKEQLTDLIDAKAELAPIKQQIEEKERLLNELPLLIERQQQYGEKIGALRTNIDRMVREAHLTLVEIDPEQELTHAVTLSAQMLLSLQAGKIREAERLSQQVDHVMEQAVAAVSKMIEIRDEVVHSIEVLERFIQDHRFTESDYYEELAKMKEQFHESVWSSMPADYEDFQQAYLELKDQLPIVIGMSEAHRYRAAQSNIQPLMELTRHINQKASELKLYSNATEALKLKRQQANENWQKYHQAAAIFTSRKLEQHNRSPELEQLMRSVRFKKERLDGLLAVPPHHLSDIESELSLLTRDVNAFCAAVETITEERERMERRLREVQSKFEHTYSRARSRSISNPYRSGYESSISNINQLIMLGLFTDAMGRLDEAERNVEQMQSAYDHLIHQEQQVELQRQQEEESRRASMDHSSGASAHDSSSGGSSFDSGSGSSGGDSW